MRMLPFLVRRPRYQVGRYPRPTSNQLALFCHLAKLLWTLSCRIPSRRLSAGDRVGALACRGGWVRLRLTGLARAYWRGQPLLRVISRPGGLETLHRTPIVMQLREGPPPRVTPPSVPPAAGRNAVVVASRAAYSRPRD